MMQLRVIPVALLFCFSACNKAADAPAVNNSGPVIPDGKNPAAMITALDSVTMAAMEQKTGTWQSADASSEWRSRATRGAVRMIDERMTVGESSSRRITHYFTDDAKLAAFIEFRIQTASATDRPPVKQFVLMKLEFMGDSVTRSEKSVDGNAQPIEPYEIENARKHSAELLATVQSTAAAPAKP